MNKSDHGDVLGTDIQEKRDFSVRQDQRAKMRREAGDFEEGVKAKVDASDL